MLRPLVVAVAALVVAAGGVAHASRITEIDVRENTKTTAATVIQISGIDKGDTWSDAVGREAERRLVDSGLFRFVLVAPEPAPNGTRVVIVARDKHSWVIAPTYYDQPTNRGGGVGFGENNLFGKNKKVLAYGQVATGDTFFIGAYVDPALAGSRFRWQYDLYLRTSRIFEYAAPSAYVDDPRPLRESRLQYLNSGLRLGVSPFRGAAVDGRVRGAHVSFPRVGLADGAAIEDVTGDPAATDVPAPGAEGWDVSAEGIVTFDTRSNWYGITRGTKVRFAYEVGLPSLGDFDYWLATGAVDHAHGFFERHTLDVRARFGIGERLPFQQEYTAGGTGLRGFRNDQLRGDLKASLNVEYSVQLFEIQGVALRGLTFADATYITFRDASNPERNYLPGAAARGMAPVKTSFGLGTRLYLRQIVIPLLGVDVGFSPERRAVELYLAIGLTDY